MTTPSTPLHELRDYFAARDVPVPRALARAISAVDRAPEHVRPRLIAAAVTITPALGPVVASGYSEPLCPAYPRVSREVQARLALGERPDQILRGLTAKEAHAALSAGVESAAAWIVDSSDLPTGTHHDGGRAAYPRTVPVARWLVACWRDPPRRDALAREQIVRGPHGEEIEGALLRRVDELVSADLPRGDATGVREAFERAAKRAYDRWSKHAATQHKPLAPAPQWSREPIRCARLLMSAAELVAEGRAMRHCVGTYAHYVRAKKSVIVSICVRARDGVHRSTAELDRSTGAVRQHRAAGNDDPSPLCVRALGVCRRRWGVEQ